MITQETAVRIAAAHRSIKDSEELLIEVEKELAKPIERVGFSGEMEPAQKRARLEWPMQGSGSYRVFNMDPMIARAVIVAHLADQKALLDKLNQIAALEVWANESAI